LAVWKQSKDARKAVKGFRSLYMYYEHQIAKRAKKARLF
jgi:hypothetical protein